MKLIEKTTESKSYRPAECDRVTIYNTKGTIALKFVCPIRGSQRAFNVGKLKWLNLNDHRSAKLKALELDNDLRLGLYDGDVSKYKLNNNYKNKKNVKTKSQTKQITLKQIWEYYKSKNSHIAKTTKTNKWSIIDKVIIDSDTVDSVAELVDRMLEKYAPSTSKSVLVALNSAINFSITHNKYQGKNYLSDIASKIKAPKKKKIKSYSKQETLTILDAFKNNTYRHDKNIYNHSYYYGLIAIRVYTGCRPCEAIALTWKDIKVRNDKTYIIFDKSYSDELKQTTKNGTDRIFPCNKKLQEIIANLPRIENDSNLVFPSIRDKSYIDRKNFTHRVWNKVIKGLYDDDLISKKLPFYDLRHTFTTHLCRSGKVDLATIASLVGNSVPTLINNYLATDESIELPDLF